MSNIVMYQTSDPVKYEKMLLITSITTREFCLRQNIELEIFVGYRRGYFPWQAERNRILALSDWLDANDKDWFVYLDADAFIADLTFDLKTYLSRHSANSLIMTHGATNRPFDMNNGVFFLNLRHPDAREIAKLWMAREALVSDEDLRKGEKWHSVPSSQTTLQALLRENPDLCKHIKYESHTLMNSSRASFIRQILRATEEDFEKRVSLIKEQVDLVMAHGSLASPSTAGG